jgi:very-short-patch-repair endonuclease
MVERRLWQMLRSRHIEGLKFVRQHPIGPYFADFACREMRLVVELDGGQHADNAYDARRDAFMTSQGYTVLRFWNTDIVENIEGVIQRIGSVARSKMAEETQTE